MLRAMLIQMASTAAPGSNGPETRLAGRFGSYRVIYVAVAVFALLYVFTVKAVEGGLGLAFDERVTDALDVQNFKESVAVQIQTRIAQTEHLIVFQHLVVADVLQPAGTQPDQNAGQC